MNRQPYGVPPRSWEAKLWPWWVACTRQYRVWQLRRGQRILSIDCQGLDRLAGAARGQGVLIVPNHSTHYDSAALYLAADRVRLPLYFMTAWQVFAMSSRFECWAMQRLGCFSVDRESNDRAAFRQAVEILQRAPYPLVIFPEGDIYHTNDRVTPFREGAAAIALAAARRSDRPLVALPCGIRFQYVDDPSDSLRDLAGRLEERLYLREGREMTLVDRIHRLAEAALALKELDYFGHTRSGRVRDRIQHLIEALLDRMEARHHLEPATPSVPVRVKQLRQHLIQKLDRSREASAESPAGEVAGRSPEEGGLPGAGGRSAAGGLPGAAPLDEAEQQRMRQEMEDLFLVMQLYSYPGDYLVDQPTIEQIAETLDKFEEDILGQDLPSVRGRRRVTIRFGEPIPVERGAQRGGVEVLTRGLQNGVQQLLDAMRTDGG